MLRWIAYRLGRAFGSLTNASAERPPQVAAKPAARDTFDLQALAPLS